MYNLSGHADPFCFLVMEVGSRNLVHVNVTAYPTSLWTIQQLREAIPSDHAYYWLIHDRSRIFSEDVDRTIKNLGIEALMADHTGAWDPASPNLQQGWWTERKCKDINFLGTA